MTLSLDKQRARARAISQKAFEAWPHAPMELEPGEPEIVRDLNNRASYWLVPGLSQGGQVLGYARILLNGKVATVARLANPAEDCAAAVTGMSAADAQRRKTAIERDQAGGAVAEPILVHDGPVGREAWLYRVSFAKAPRLRIFATAGGTYLHPGKDRSSVDGSSGPKQRT